MSLHPKEKYSGGVHQVESPAGLPNLSCQDAHRSAMVRPPVKDVFPPESCRAYCKRMYLIWFRLGVYTKVIVSDAHLSSS